jgi:hypothetical protein
MLRNGVLTMGITLHQDGDRQYYRITKAWNGKEVQQYVRIGRNRDAAWRKAQQVEEGLAQRQRAALTRKRMDGSGILNPDGHVTGLQLLYRTRAGRTPWFEFKLRVKEPGKPVRFRTVSISSHGFIDAFELSVAGICELRDIDTGSALAQRLFAARHVYLADISIELARLPGVAVAGRERIEAELARLRDTGDGSDSIYAAGGQAANVSSVRAETATPGCQESGTPEYQDYELALKAARNQFMTSKSAIRG